MPNDFRRELELLARELEELKAALLRYAARDREEILASAVAELPPEQQTVLSLRYQEGLTREEVVTVLGMSDGAVCRVELDALKSITKSVSQLKKEG